MSENVDVLAEMERASNRLFDAGLHGGLSIEKARDAVAELIEATNAYLDGRKWYNPLYANKRQFDTFAAIESRLTAALVCVRSAS